jgi:tetratricopeptide (TPR) repeat protein
MNRPRKPTRRRRVRVSASSESRSLLKRKTLAAPKKKPVVYQVAPDPAMQQQLKYYEEGLQYFQQQKYAKAKPVFEKVLTGPNKEFADRAKLHLRITEQRLQRSETPTPRSFEEHYQHGVAMMNMGNWDEAREHLLRARKMAPKTDYIIYALAALDCLTGEAEAAMENLKIAIQLRPENRYHARNDEDFAFLQEDPRFTELLYPDRESSN